MKFYVFITCVLIILCSCSVAEDIDSIPEGVYIAGIYTDSFKETIGACYWTGNRRHNLNGWSTSSIAFSDGNVIVDGLYLVPSSDGAGIEVGGDLYKYNRCYWIDGIRHDDEKYIPSDNYRPFIVTVHNGKVYSAGLTAEFPFFNYNICYFVDDEMHFITSNANGISYQPTAITIEDDGTVHIAGIGLSSIDITHFVITEYWYFTDGNFIIIEADNYTIIDTDNNTAIVNIGSISIFENKVYIFGTIEDEDGSLINGYWVDGERVNLNLPDDAYVSDYLFARGSLWMAGSYKRGNRSIACYWVDGERFDLSGYSATSIYVEE